jgi:hypothetical protein
MFFKNERRKEMAEPFCNCAFVLQTMDGRRCVMCGNYYETPKKPLKSSAKFFFDRGFEKKSKSKKTVLKKPAKKSVGRSKGMFVEFTDSKLIFEGGKKPILTVAAGERMLDCPNYINESCLNYAIRKNLATYNCEGCPGYKES